MTSESPTHPDAPRAGGETPPLDVEACVRLLDDLIRMLAPHDAQSIADANLLRALGQLAGLPVTMRFCGIPLEKDPGLLSGEMRCSTLPPRSEDVDAVPPPSP